MPRKAELLEQLLCQELWYACDSYSGSADFLVALEEWLVRSIEYE
jgi:hypothetical protein